MTRTRSPYDPRTNPPRQRTRTPLEDDAVIELRQTPCTGRPTSDLHLIPATTTICISCGRDALTYQQLEIPV